MCMDVYVCMYRVALTKEEAQYQCHSVNNVFIQL